MFYPVSRICNAFFIENFTIEENAKKENNGAFCILSTKFDKKT